MDLLPWSSSAANAGFASPITVRCLKASALVAMCAMLMVAAGRSSPAQTAHLTGGQGMLGAEFGSINVGATSAPVALTFTFDTAGTLGSDAVLMQGALGLDFADAGTGTCTPNTAYAAGQSCTVNVTFAPKFAGTRYGAVVLNDTSGNVFATGYLEGTGVGPQVSFLPDTESVIPNTSLSNPHGIAVDGNGNLYVSDNYGIEKITNSDGSYSQTVIVSGLTSTNLLAVDGAGNLYIADTSNQRVLKESPGTSGYSQSVVDGGFGYPYGVAVDSSGNVYIADAWNNQVLKETPSGANSYARSTVISGLSDPDAISVDKDGNLYITQLGIGYGTLLKETPSAGGYTATALPIAGQIDPNVVAVDGTGNVYFSDSNTHDIYKETPTSSGYVESTVVTDLHDISGPWGLAPDGSGKMYIAYPGGNSIVKADFADPPTLNFANTAVGTTSPDSPLSVTLVNDGNSPLDLEIPPSGNNPSIDPNFTLDASQPADCPIVTPGSSSPGVLTPGANCLLSISYAPQQPGPNIGTLTLTDNNLNATAPNYASQSVNLNGTDVTPTFTISPSPSSLAFDQGTSASSTLTITSQTGFSVNASLSVSGLPTGVTAVFSQNPTRDSSTLTFAASDTATLGNATVTITGTFGSEVVTATITLQVRYSLRFSLYVNPQDISIGAGDSLTATVGVIDYLGFTGSVNLSTSGFPAGVTASFSPSSTTSTSLLTITQAGPLVPGQYLPLVIGTSGSLPTESATIDLMLSNVPTITWPNPAPITYGTPLSATQLDATASVPGTFGYSPSAGVVLYAGTQQPLFVFFTPTDSTDYTTASRTDWLTVNPATPTLSWPAPTAIAYGTALSATQLDATANVPGTFTYSPAAGTVLIPGTQTLAVTFTPTDTTDYTTATATVQLTVNLIGPIFKLPIDYPTATSSTQHGATANVSGTSTSNPAAGNHAVHGHGRAADDPHAPR